MAARFPVPIPSLDDPESEAAEAEAEAGGFAETEDWRTRLIAALSPTPIGTDELSRSTGLGVRVVQTTLLELELDGRIERHGNGAVSLIA